MKTSEKILFSCNKHSGKSWWNIIEHFTFIFIILLFIFACIPTIGLGFSIDSLVKISGHKLVLYNGFTSISFNLFLVFLAMFVCLWLTSFKIWEVARKFRKNLYYHGKTDPRENDGEYLLPLEVWEKFPPES